MKRSALISVILIVALLLPALSVANAQDPSTSTSTSSPASSSPSQPQTNPTVPTNNNPQINVAPVITNPTPEPVVVNNQPEGEHSMNNADLAYGFFRGGEDTGMPTLDVYDLTNGSTNGVYLFSITQEDLAPYLLNLPTENTQLFAEGQVVAYVLTTGEIQINVGPDSEGKIYVRIFDGIPWTHVYGYTIDPVQ